MIYTKEINDMCVVAKGPNHGPAPIPEEGKWIQAKEIKDISGLWHDSWYWLVRSTAGLLQAVTQRKGRRHRGGSR